MSSESKLRETMHSSAHNSAVGIDIDDVVRRARARRVPKQVAFSSLSVLAIAGIATFGISYLPSLQPGQGASDSSVMATMPESLQDSGGADASSKTTEARERTQNLCGSPTVNTPPNSAGLTLSVSFPDSSRDRGEDIAGTVTLTNTGTSSVSGTTAISPTLFVSRDGITVWHSHGAMVSIVAEIALAPGQSFTYDAFFTPVECGEQDDVDGEFRDNLPALTAGSYDVTAEIVFVPNNSDAGGSFVVGGPAHTIELR